MSPVRINWDMDGVLAQLFEAVLSEYNRRYNHDLTAEDARVYHIGKMPGIRCPQEEVWEIIAGVDYAEVPAYQDVVKIARTFADRGIPSAVVSALTWYPPNPHAMMKRAWVHRFLGKDFAVIYTHDKHWCCRNPKDILIDDKATTIEKWPGQGLLLERPWNRDERPEGMTSCPPEALYHTLLEMVHR